MTVLEGEGRVSILYGSQPLPESPYPSVYLARPDAEGRHPGVVVAYGGVTSSAKAACRRLARYGYAAVAAETPDLEGAMAALKGPWDAWTSSRLAVLAVGDAMAAGAAVADRHGSALILLGGAASVPVDPLRSGEHPILGLLAGASDDVAALHEAAGRGQWVRYGEVGVSFHDENSPEFASEPAEDAYQRVISFLDRRLAPASLPG